MILTFSTLVFVTLILVYM